MKPPKRSIADHLSFITWIILCIVITLMMIQIPKAADALTLSEAEDMYRNKNEEPDLRAYTIGLIKGAQQTLAITTEDQCYINFSEEQKTYQHVIDDLYEIIFDDPDYQPSPEIVKHDSGYSWAVTKLLTGITTCDKDKSSPASNKTKKYDI